MTVGTRRASALFVVWLACASAVSAAELRVPGQFATIQQAVTAAVNGDTIVVAPGTYRESIDLLGKRITLRSSGGADVTILDGADHATPIVKATRGESTATVIEGFTFRHGAGEPTPACNLPGRKGGAIFTIGSGLTVRDSRFENNGSLDSDGNESVSRGGAIFACSSNLTISDSTFDANRAGNGGGAVYFIGTSTRQFKLERTTFRRNESSFGGAIDAVLLATSTFVVSDCDFEGNRAAHGGAISADASRDTTMRIERVTFAGHIGSATGSGLLASLTEGALMTLTDSTFTGGASSFGAGAFLHASGDALIDVLRCEFRGNDASFGGGLFVQATGNLPAVAGGRIRIDGSRFLDNVARHHASTGIVSSACFRDGQLPEGNGLFYGGGADVRTLFGGSVTITNSLFAGNSGMRAGGLHAGSCAGGTIDGVNTTIVDNEGSGLMLRFGLATVGEYPGIARVNVVNSIVRDNRNAQQIVVEPTDPRTTAAVTFSNVAGGFAGERNIDLEPKFVAPAARDYRLAQGSPCIDAGNNEALPGATRFDLAGRTRFTDDPQTRDRGIGAGAPIVDLGAYEFQPAPASRRRSASR